MSRVPVITRIRLESGTVRLGAAGSHNQAQRARQFGLGVEAHVGVCAASGVGDLDVIRFVAGHHLIP